jgi:hypothetical protein
VADGGPLGAITRKKTMYGGGASRVRQVIVCGIQEFGNLKPSPGEKGPRN